MNRIAGIILAVIGFIVAVLSVLKILPGLTGSGVGLLLAGGLIIGLSFVSRPEDDGTERMPTPSTLINIFFSPAEAFQNLRRHPRWLVALLIMAALSATYSNLFINRLTAERVVNYSIDKTLEMSFVANNEEAKKKIEEGRPQAIADVKNPITRAGQAVGGFGWSLIGYSFLALIFFLFALAMGGKLNFYQALSVAVYASLPVSILRFVLNTTILFIKDPTDVHPILGQTSLIQDNLNFLVLSSEHPVIFTILGSISLLFFYWIWMMAVGLKNTGERVTGTIAWSAALTVYFLLVFLGVTAALLFPGFIS